MDMFMLSYTLDLDVYFTRITTTHKLDDDVNLIKSLVPAICTSLRPVYTLEELSYQYKLLLFTIHPLSLVVLFPAAMRAHTDDSTSNSSHFENCKRDYFYKFNLNALLDLNHPICMGSCIRSSY